MTGLKRAVVVGAGFIGLEFAAAAAAAGAEVTVIEATSRPMSRALTDPMSQFFRNAHEKAGVRFVFEAVVTEVHGKAGHVSEVETADGRIFPADLVLVGIGVIPECRTRGRVRPRGGERDRRRRDALHGRPGHLGRGDCAAYPLASGGGARVRLESVQNAIDHGRCVASRLMGRPRPYHIVPWFWSDQGRYKLQIAGFSMPSDRVALRGDPTIRSLLDLLLQRGTPRRRRIGQQAGRSHGGPPASGERYLDRFRTGERSRFRPQGLGERLTGAGERARRRHDGATRRRAVTTPTPSSD